MSAAAPRVLIVFNPVSGRGQGAALAAATAERLRERGAVVEQLPTSASEDVYATVRAEDHDCILVVGGDGSFHAAVNGLADLRAPLAFAGTGTVNVLSVERGLPRDAEGLTALVLGDHTAEMPLLEANGRRFVLFAEFGFLGEVVQRVNAWRTRTGKHGKLEFLVESCRVLPFRWGRPLRAHLVREDGTVVEGRFSNLLATRARCYGGNMPMPIERAVAEPLELSSFLVVGMRTRTPLGHLLLLGLAAAKLLPSLAGLLRSLGLLEVQRVRELTVEAPAGTGMHLDAESPPDGLASALSAGTGGVRVAAGSTAFRLLGV